MTPYPTPTRTASTTPVPGSSNCLASTPTKPSLNMSDSINPSQWLNFSLPPRQRPTGPQGVPRRSRRAEGWRAGIMSRERYVQANFRFVLKPTEMLSYGAHFADPDIPLHWPNILQVLVPTFSAFSVAQGYVSSDAAQQASIDDELGSLDEDELDAMPDEAADRRRRIEEERRGRMCPICLGVPVSGRMTKCGHIFCFPCILHFIQLSDIPKSAKCPICGDTVHEGMLKSVKYLDAIAMLAAAEGEGGHSIATDQVDSPRPTSRAVHEFPEHHEHELVLGHLDGFEESHVEHVNDSKPNANAPSEAAEEHLIHMRLVQRPQMTTLALPSSPTWPSDAVPPHTAPWYFLPDVLSHSRFMLASPDYMLAELQRELGELKAEWDIMRGDELGRGFVRAAKEKVERQVGKVRAELMTDLVKRNEEQIRDTWVDAVGGDRREQERKRDRERKERQRAEEAKKEDAAGEAALIPNELLATQHITFDMNTPTSATTNDSVIPPNLPVEPNPMPSGPSRKARRRAQVTASTVPQATPFSSSYYFYQSSLGANVFLHPLDIRILLAHFKSYSLFPQTLSFTSSGFDPGTINDELKKRCKYLGHLPAGTEVIFVEADLEDVIGKEALVAFEQPLKARREKRRARARKEDRAKVRWETQEREKMPTLPNLAQPLNREDQAFNDALIRSAIEAQMDGPREYLSADGSGQFGSSFEPGSASSSRLGPSPGTSPNSVWGGDVGGQRTFASTLSSATATAPRPRAKLREPKEDDWEVDAVWDEFNSISLDRGSVRETEKGGGEASTIGKNSHGGATTGGRKGWKKQKKTLVLGGAGRGAR